MKNRSGFANPEYMLVLAAILVSLAVIVPPVVREVQRRRTFKALAALREAAARYAADAKTKGPLELADLTKDGRYLAAIPPAVVPIHHGSSAQVAAMARTDDAGGWTHANWPGSEREGQIWINCTHTDTRGSLWSSY